MRGVRRLHRMGLIACYYRAAEWEHTEVMLAILDSVQRVTSPFSLVALRELGGAVSRVPVDATAFAHRDKAFYVAADNSWEVGPAEPHVAWTERSGRRWRRTQPARTPTSSRTKARIGSGPPTRPKVRPAGRYQGPLRPRQPLPVEPEHRAGVNRRPPTGIHAIVPAPDLQPEASVRDRTRAPRHSRRGRRP